MAVIGLIPARGGSKRVPKKNIAPCAGQPLLAWTAQAALGSSALDRVLLSTDDEEIAALGRELGLEVPFLRPSDIAEDAAPMLPVMRHALDWALDWAAAEGETVEAQVLLQPTSPLRRAEHIDEAVALFRESGAESLVSVVELGHAQHPLVSYALSGDRLSPYFPDREPNGEAPAYVRNGPAILINRPEVIRRGERLSEDLVAYVMAPEVSVDIDTPFDLAFADFLMTRGAAA